MALFHGIHTRQALRMLSHSMQPNGTIPMTTVMEIIGRMNHGIFPEQIGVLVHGCLMLQHQMPALSFLEPRWETDTVVPILMVTDFQMEI